MKSRLDGCDDMRPRRKYIVTQLSVLAQSPAAKYVCFPSTILRHGWDDVFLFPNLASLGFTNIVPHLDYFARYVDAVVDAVDAVNKAGMVHGDLCPTNVMWREKDGRIEVQLIDWDTIRTKDDAKDREVLQDYHDPELVDFLCYDQNRRKEDCVFDRFALEVLQWIGRSAERVQQLTEDWENGSNHAFYELREDMIRMIEYRTMAEE